MVIAGAEDAVLEVAARFDTAKRLRVSHAFHSPLMDPMLDEFQAVVETLTFTEPAIPIVSTVDTDQPINSPRYWIHHARRTVRFAQAITALHEAGTSTFVELGPDGVLCALTQDNLTEAATTVAIPTLRKDRNEPTSILTALATTHVHGTTIDWKTLHTNTTPHPTDPPTYPFQHQRYWPDARRSSGDAAAIGIRSGEHPILGGTVELAGADEMAFTGRLSAGVHPWLADHVVKGSAFVPGTVFLDLAIYAGDQIGCQRVEDLHP